MAPKQTLTLFHKTAQDVPAYRDFLKARGVNPEDIKTGQDYTNVPITSKKNYLEQYGFAELNWSGNLLKPLIFCSTSGSTGIPFYFPRNEELSWQYSLLIEEYLLHRKKVEQGPVLIIIAFGMGIWIGGIITLRALEIATERMNYPASLLPVGYNKTEVLKALRQLAPHYEQTILIGYPPFVKQIIDDANREQINLKKLNLRLLFAAEAFNEKFRDYVCKKTGADPLLDTLNIYGTADIGAMAYETPVSIMIRRLATKQPKLFQEIFGQIEKTPTLAQFNPQFMWFEEVDGEVILSGNSALPLIRYAIGDHGGVIPFQSMQEIFKKVGLDLNQEAKKAKIDHTVLTQPFVFVYERVNLSVTLHGINIYPEFIKDGLLDIELSPYLTERFTMITKFTKDHNQYLEINLELQKDVQISQRVRRDTKKIIREYLIKRSSEFAEISKGKDSAKLIKFVYWPNEHPRYFSPGIKQKWAINIK